MYQEKWEALSEKTRKILEIVAGLVLSALVGVFLMRSSGEEGMWGTMAAFALALFGPRILENQTGNKLPLMRRFLLIGLLVVVALTVVILLREGV